MLTSPRRGSEIPLPLGFFHSFAVRMRAFPRARRGGLRALAFPLGLCLLSEELSIRKGLQILPVSGCLADAGSSTDIWQDNSECAESHSFKQKVSWLGSVRADLRAQTTLCRGSTQRSLPQRIGPRLMARSLVTQNRNSSGRHSLSSAAGLRHEPLRKDGQRLSLLLLPPGPVPQLFFGFSFPKATFQSQCLLSSEVFQGHPVENGLSTQP